MQATNGSAIFTNTTGCTEMSFPKTGRETAGGTQRPSDTEFVPIFFSKIQVLNAKTNKQKHLNCDSGKRAP